MEPSNNVEDHRPENSTLSSEMSNLEISSSKPPSLRMPADNFAPAMTSSSAPLGPTNAARRPGPLPKPSGLNSNTQSKMKAFLESRGSSQNVRPGFPNGQSSSAGQGQSGGPTGGPTPGMQAPPGGAFAGGMKLPLRMPGPNSPSWSPTPGSAGASPRINPKGPMGGLSAKRGMKPGGMKLSEAHKPPAANEGEPQQQIDEGSQFKKYEKYVDLQKGTLNFENKAIVHSGGIDFSSGSTFSISLDEVDTLSELGKGNYGTVFKVKHARPKMRRPGQGLRGNMSRQAEDDQSPTSGSTKTSGLVMAMKELRLELEDAKFAQIIMELDILHRCTSPFIIDFYGAFFQEGSVYICIEYMDGGSIDKLYGDGVPEGVLKKMTLSTVMGLKSLKDDHNIIHRDVKPTNILVNTQGQFKICDFGVSGNLVASIARTNIGCQSYMAPERISGGGIAQAGATGGGSYSVQSDIWSLGLSIIECALGRYPYPPETYDNIFSQLSAIVDGDPPDLPVDNYSETARDFVQSCLNKVPMKRPTYAALIRHPWLSPLMQPPTISEDAEAEKNAEAGGDTNGSGEPVADVADKEVSDWVIAALEKKRAGKMGESAKPALHAAPLDAVAATSPPVDPSHAPIAPNPGIRVDSPELTGARVHSIDFASGVESSSSS